jgi:import inner membrane translocase subunit TIM23
MILKRFSSTLPQLLSWTDFFQLRKSKKTWERVGGFLSGTTGLIGGSWYFFTVAEFDPTQPLLGLPDPTIAYVLGALSVSAIATATGLLGSGALWRLTHRKSLAALDLREKEFFHRLTKYRPKELKFLAVPGSGEVTLPDYYGEKIHSVKDYRSWIRKQKRFIARNIEARVR